MDIRRKNLGNINVLYESLTANLAELNTIITNYYNKHKDDENYLNFSNPEDRNSFIDRAIGSSSIISASVKNTARPLTDTGFFMAKTAFQKTVTTNIKLLKDNLTKFAALNTVSTKDHEHCQTVITQLDELQKTIDSLDNSGNVNQINSLNTKETKEENNNPKNT